MRLLEPEQLEREADEARVRAGPREDAGQLRPPERLLPLLCKEVCHRRLLPSEAEPVLRRALVVEPAEAVVASGGHAHVPDAPAAVRLCRRVQLLLERAAPLLHDQPLHVGRQLALQQPLDGGVQAVAQKAAREASGGEVHLAPLAHVRLQVRGEGEQLGQQLEEREVLAEDLPGEAREQARARQAREKGRHVAGQTKLLQNQEHDVVMHHEEEQAVGATVTNIARAAAARAAIAGAAGTAAAARSFGQCAGCAQNGGLPQQCTHGQPAC
mmetsp:Transcript_17900/g.53014  ORF Transcript_17900/g.53014 Transcript_17900/m.53014 type:complete len:270 (+) Transcript_17900:421-1230(+)